VQHGGAGEEQQERPKEAEEQRREVCQEDLQGTACLSQPPVCTRSLHLGAAKAQAVHKKAVLLV
jgi:hypothetical protein